MNPRPTLTNLWNRMKCAVISSSNRLYVTPSFVDDIIASGRLTESRQRLENGSFQPDTKINHTHRPTWELVLDEVLDTDFNPPEYDALYAELLRRGYSHADIDDMRRLAWETAGWLNYDLMVWDWCHLDEADMKKTLDLQLEKGMISTSDFHAKIGRIAKISARPIPA